MHKSDDSVMDAGGLSGVVMETETLKKRLWRVRESFTCLLVVTVVASAFIAWQANEKSQQYRDSWGSVPVKPPQNPPELSQDSIDLAIVMFGIKLSPGTAYPRFERDLVDRGVTVKSNFLDHNRVGIGPAAFSSWGLLGSTLAHELEVHCEQSFLAVWFLDWIGLGGTELAERHAYLHEIKNKKRFGLKGSEVAMIAETLDFYYPDFRDTDEDVVDLGESSPGLGAKLRGILSITGPKRAAINRWLARNLIGPHHVDTASEK
jgi:hypothetical protein